LKACVLQA